MCTQPGHLQRAPKKHPKFAMVLWCSTKAPSRVPAFGSDNRSAQFQFCKLLTQQIVHVNYIYMYINTYNHINKLNIVNMFGDNLQLKSLKSTMI